MADADEIPGRLTVGQLLEMYPHTIRITGWDPSNPPAVERAFRVGYLTGVRRFVESRGFGFVHDEPCDLELAAGVAEHLDRRRGEQYDRECWSDRRAALLRGCEHGLLDGVRARAAGVSPTMLVGWLDELREWAVEEPPGLDWEYAMPPDAPEPDGPPLGRDGLPKRLWGEVFGLWALLTPPAEPRPLGNIERMLHSDPTVRRAASQQTTITNGDSLASRDPTPVTVRLSNVQPELLRWLWPGRIALGKLTLLCGDPGLGKSFVTLDLAARVSSSTAWPDLPLLPNPPQRRAAQRGR